MQFHTSHPSTQDDWLSLEEGQLSVDVLETATHLIIRSVIAGVAASDIDLQVTVDAVTIRGTRHEAPLQQEAVEHIKECFWGTFSRSIVLPCPVIPEAAEANFKLGILTIFLKKAELSSSISITDLDYEI